MTEKYNEDMGTYTSEEFSLRSRLYWLTRTKAGIAIGYAAFLGLFVGAVITAQTLYSATVANAKEFAILLALGIPRWRISPMVLAQSFWVGVIGIGLAIPSVLHPPLRGHADRGRRGLAVGGVGGGRLRDHRHVTDRRDLRAAKRSADRADVAPAVRLSAKSCPRKRRVPKVEHDALGGKHTQRRACKVRPRSRTFGDGTTRRAPLESVNIDLYPGQIVLLMGPVREAGSRRCWRSCRGCSEPDSGQVLARRRRADARRLDQ